MRGICLEDDQLGRWNRFQRTPRQRKKAEDLRSGESRDRKIQSRPALKSTAIYALPTLLPAIMWVPQQSSYSNSVAQAPRIFLLDDTRYFDNRP